jgi:tetratricopeptide (TPR) repeat protein
MKKLTFLKKLFLNQIICIFAPIFTINNNFYKASLNKLNQIFNESVLWFFDMILKRTLALTTILISLLLFNFVFAQADIEQKYKEAVSSADKYFSSGDYINAKASYQYASKIKPDESYPKQKLKETMDKLHEKMAVMSEYNKELTEADRLFRLKEYEEAKVKYEAASKILPDEKYPKEKVDAIEKIFNEKALKQAEYDDAVSRGDKGMQYKKYETAIKEYEKALQVFPNEEYPKTQIEEARQLADEYNSIKLQYDEAITAADRLFSLKYYEKAKESYEIAGSVKPNEDYPVEQINKIDKLLVKKNEYDKLVSEADELYMGKDLALAKTKYQEALKIYPSESYPKDMIDKMNEKLKELSSKDDLYNNAIADADAFFNSGDYANATKEFENALSIKPEEQYPQTKIDEIKGLLAKLGADENSYNDAIQKGEQFLGNIEYEKAKAEFEKASALKPSEQLPKDKIASIDKLIVERNAVQGSYDNAIALADKALADKNFEVAITQYQNALIIISGDKYAQKKIEEVEKLKADFALTQKNYNKVIAEADKLFEKKSYDGAKIKYNEAKEIDPSQTYPDDRLLVISQLFAEKQSAEENYQMTITMADNLFDQEKYPEALTEYQNANKLKPGEDYPSDKIDEIGNILSAQKTKQANYEKALAAGDSFFEESDYEKALAEYQKAAGLIPENEYPATKIVEINTILKERAAKGQQYAAIITEADQLFKDKSYQDAKTKYQSALDIQPNEPKPTERIAEIDNILDNLKAVQESYNSAITTADNYFNSGQYESAELKYKEAQKIMPDKEYSATKIAEIASIINAADQLQSNYNNAIALGDKLFMKQDYEGAKSEYEKATKLKPNEEYPKSKIQEVSGLLASIMAQQNSYEMAIAAADKLFNEKQYVEAKIEYQKALKLKPDAKYPSDKIKEIDKILQSQKIAMGQYNELLQEGDALFAQGKYDKAMIQYQTASTIRPTEQYPKDKLFEIKKRQAEELAVNEQFNKAMADAEESYKQKYYDQALLRYQDAVKLKPGSKKAQDRIAEITTMLASKAKNEKDYNDAISQGDNLFALKNYSEAKLSYMKASNIKSKEEYPKTKITEIENLIASQKAQQAEYNRIIAAADRMMDSRDYLKAKEKYNEALGVLPNEQYPKDKLKAIADIILAQELSVQEAYNAKVGEADAFMANKQYDQAKLKYQEALKMRPDEEYPVQKLAEIERLVTDLATLQANYSRLIAVADKSFKAKEYGDAKSKYVEAAALMPEETYPKGQIEAINKIFKAEMERIQQNYDKAIADADKFFSANVFGKALDSYRMAKRIKPDEDYPDEMVNKILKILDENAVRNVMGSPVTIANQAVEKFTFDPVTITNRKASLIYIKAKNITGNEFRVVMSYGKGSGKNGGFMIPIPATDKAKEFIIPIGKQDKWFTEDNDWLSLTPQGGDVEVMLIKITRGD